MGSLARAFQLIDCLCAWKDNVVDDCLLKMHTYVDRTVGETENFERHIYGLNANEHFNLKLKEAR